MRQIPQTTIYACALALAASSYTHAQSDLTITNKLKVEANPSNSRLEMRGNGIIIGKGAVAQDDLTAADLTWPSPSPLLLWYPGKSAVRAGHFGSQNPLYIGQYSAAFGELSYAPGKGAFAAGRGNASHDYAFSAGNFTQAIGAASVALGYSTIAFNEASFAMGNSSYATGVTSTAIGVQVTAYGDRSLATNDRTLARGTASTAMGTFTKADTVNSVAIGRYNVGVADTGGWTVWRASDPLFEVGNGTGTAAGQRSNAFTVYKNGTAEVGGSAVVTASSFPTLLGNANGNLTFSPTEDRSITINQSASGAGKTLTVQAGAAAEGSSDQAGGTLVLSAGGSTGIGGSTIEFRTAGSSASGTSSNGPTIRLKINSSGGIEAGEGLSAAAAPQFVVGKYNRFLADGTGNHGEGLFVIGAGTEDTPEARKNAMRVLEDGTILIRQQGDLLMGAFGGGDQP